MNGEVTEAGIWQAINSLGWWYWGPVAAGAACCLWALYRLPNAKTFLGKAARSSLFFGFFLVAFSWRNSAFGPLAMPFLMFGWWGFLHRQYRRLDAEGKIPKAEGTLATRIVTTMVERPR